MTTPMTSMTLSHWSDEPITQVHDTPQLDDWDWKPHGLWVSVDGEDDWAWWCDREEYEDLSVKHRYQVVLADDANILYLATADDLIGFHVAHGVADPGQARLKWINWAPVATRYQGVIIARYQWRLRLDLSWYYSWDCASGCVWDAAAIKELRDWDGEAGR